MKLKSLLCAIALITASAQASAAVVYDVFSHDLDMVIGEIRFLDSVASDDSAWSIASGTQLSTVVDGGLSGLISALAGIGTVASGDLTITSDLGSNDGLEIDFGVLSGNLETTVGAEITQITFGTAPVFDVLDATVPLFGPLQFNMSFVAVPAPGPFALAALGLACVVTARRVGQNA
ncbi:MAG: hypothetical protein AAF458_13465 [Pseudomonadota bacterium]